ncbi:unnamed protein product, partial [Mesorhabditis belari]|uniref:Saposin B-type domain-containing protein n=1 Tax=Mesorhabditis belari TaxID=2138241 RepID=A0AAF3EJ05_9BILA
MRSLILATFVFLSTTWAQTTPRAVDPCSMCEYVVNQAQQHYHRNEDKGEVERELLNDCNTLKRFYGEQAVKDCDSWIRKNIDVIYRDLRDGKSTYQICYDMGECGVTGGTMGTTQRTTTTPAIQMTTTPSTTTTTTTRTTTTTTTTTRTTTTTTVTTTTPLDMCYVCQYVIDQARAFFNNRVTDEVALKSELLSVCQSLSSQYGQDVVQGCINDINQYIDVIFVDLVNKKASKDVCIDMKECM